MKLPNGYGSVYKLSGNRRKPFVARKTIGWDDEGKQLYQTIGYYAKRTEALAALTEFNTNPYSVEASTVTFAELYEKWKDLKFEGISRSGVTGYKVAFGICAQLHDQKFVDIRARDMQEVIRHCDKGHATLRKVKVLLKQLYKYAMENDIVHKDYAKFVDLGKNTEGQNRSIFSGYEIERLFDVVNEVDYADTILIMIYTGLRIGELLTIEIANVDLECGTIVGGLKTAAGRDRVVPIHSKIRPFVEKRHLSGFKYLVNKGDDKPITYRNYYDEKFKPLMKLLNMEHKPHDCRHTFATLMSNAGADTVALQKIIGHASYQTTANVYTHKDIDQLKKAIELI